MRTKGRVYLVWSDNSKKETAADIWCARAGGSAEFSKLINISSTTGVSSEPAVAADNHGRIAVAWSDTASGVSHPDIYVRVGVDNLDLISFAIDMTNTTGMSKHPHLTIAGKRLIVVWEEIEGESSLVKVTSMSLDGIPTGSSFGVDRARVNGKFVEF